MQPVYDSLSHSEKQIAHAAKLIGRSIRAAKVFSFVYKGKKASKSVKEIAVGTGLSEWDVLTVGRKFSNSGVFQQEKGANGTAYKKVPIFVSNRDRVIRDAKKQNKSQKSPEGTVTRIIINRGAPIRVTEVTINDIDEFKKVKNIRGRLKNLRVLENSFKEGVKKLLGETGRFKDWGGEKNDLLTSKGRINGQRRTIAFQFKGPGTTGILTPRKLGAKGDQIQRLLSSAADVFIVQYWKQIDESVVEQMNRLATEVSVSKNKRIWVGIIDGTDTKRLLNAYPKNFGIR